MLYFFLELFFLEILEDLYFNCLVLLLLLLKASTVALGWCFSHLFELLRHLQFSFQLKFLQFFYLVRQSSFELLNHLLGLVDKDEISVSISRANLSQKLANFLIAADLSLYSLIGTLLLCQGGQLNQCPHNIPSHTLFVHKMIGQFAPKLISGVLTKIHIDVADLLLNKRWVVELTSPFESYFSFDQALGLGKLIWFFNLFHQYSVFGCEEMFTEGCIKKL